DPLDPRISSKGLPGPVSQQCKGVLVWAAHQTADRVPAQVNRDDPLGRLFLRPFAHIRQGDPEPVSSVRGPEAPAIVLLDRTGEVEPALLLQRAQLALQPGREVFAEATGIDEMRSHLPVLENVRLDGDRVAHGKYLFDQLPRWPTKTARLSSSCRHAAVKPASRSIARCSSRVAV